MIKVETKTDFVTSNGARFVLLETANRVEAELAIGKVIGPNLVGLFGDAARHMVDNVIGTIADNRHALKDALTHVVNTEMHQDDAGNLIASHLDALAGPEPVRTLPNPEEVKFDIKIETPKKRKVKKAAKKKAAPKPKPKAKKKVAKKKAAPKAKAKKKVVKPKGKSAWHIARAKAKAKRARAAKAKKTAKKRK